MADCTRVQIAKLSNANYAVWSFKVRMLLVKEDVWDVVFGAVPATPDTAWSKRDGKAMATISLLVEDNQLVHIRTKITAKAMWDSLREYHQKATLTSKVFLYKRLYSLRLSETGNMETHITGMLDVIEQLTALGETLADHVIVALLLCSLPDSYDTLVMALESRPEKDLTVELVKGKLIQEWNRRLESKKNESFSHADVSVLSDRTTAMTVTAERKKIKTRRKCYYCNKLGHLKAECRKFKADQMLEKNKGSHSNKINLVSLDSKDSVNASVNENQCVFKVTSVQDRNMWYIDSGATCHMSNCREFFSSLDENYQENVYVADGRSLKAKGKGNGLLQCLNDSHSHQTVNVTDVIYVPELDGNLLSVERLTGKGLHVVFDQHGCNIIDSKGSVVAKAMLDNHLYRLEQPESALMVRRQLKKECIHLWHRQMGHSHIDAVRSLETKGLTTGVSNCNQLQVCECCFEGKMARLPFPTSVTRSKAILELVHTDLCGPMQQLTPSGNKYVLTFVDDYSRFTHVVLLKNKSATVDAIRNFVRQQETQYGQKPKVFRSDRGGEYTSNRLQSFLREEGIEWQFTAPYTPQQNGVAERKNRTIIEMTKCMLSDAKLHIRYWGEAVMTATYLQNRLPSRAVGKTPFELWYGTIPNLNHIRTFGCIAFVHVPDERRQKLDKKADRVIFVGYENNSKAYRLLNPETDKVVISRDVHFVELYDHSEHLPPTNSLPNEAFAHQMSDEDCTKECVVEFAENKETTEAANEAPQVDEEVRKSQRRNKGQPPERLIQVMNVSSAFDIKSEPRDFTEALSCADSKHWDTAMKEELKLLQENDTWTLSELPSGRKAVGSKWVFKRKLDVKGNTNRFKARLVAQGFSQRFGEDYDEVFAPVSRQQTFRALLSVASRHHMTVHHFDIKTAFLNGKLHETVYMKQPEGFVKPGEENLVCKLNRSLYGLKQSAKVWNDRLNNMLQAQGFKKGIADPCLYSKWMGQNWLYVLVYVDDLIVASVDDKQISWFFDLLSKEFIVTDLGDLNLFLGIQVNRNDERIFCIHQSSYIERILERFGLNLAKPAKSPMDKGYPKLEAEDSDAADKDLYRQAIGCLLYVSTCSRPDIAASISLLSRKMENPTQRDWTAVKRVMRYLKGTINFKLSLGNSSEAAELTGYADADWAGDVRDRKSNSGYIFKWHGGTISWASRKQTSVSLSSTEAEYVALCEACKEALWLKRLFQDLHEEVCIMRIFEDNQSCLKMLKDDKGNGRTKHIDTKFHFIKHLAAEENFVFEYCPTECMTADLLTKPLDNTRVFQLARLAGLEKCD